VLTIQASSSHKKWRVRLALEVGQLSNIPNEMVNHEKIVPIKY
jgi:hypothetical protein